jgi:hypothetical protein
MRILILTAMSLLALSALAQPVPAPKFVDSEVLREKIVAGWSFRVVPSDVGGKPDAGSTRRLVGQPWRCQAAPPGVKWPSSGRDGLYSFPPRADGCHAEDVNGGLPTP